MRPRGFEGGFVGAVRRKVWGFLGGPEGERRKTCAAHVALRSARDAKPLLHASKPLEP